MAVKLLDVATLRRELKILDTFSVVVKYTPRPTLASLMATTTGMAAGDVAAMYAKQCVAGWVGLTPGIARRLSVPLSDEAAAADGQVPYDEEMSAAMWEYAYADRYSTPILNLSWTLLEAVEKEKAGAKNGSGASSAPEPTP
ncbi:MAG: hypothetical protein AB7I42_23100 [Bradyrhizobium sp.]|uniref:hypothetical protein n=1 Tax=Bradyrhizobium sp. TaxID=376 RepID=UPI003D13562B